MADKPKLIKLLERYHKQDIAEKKAKEEKDGIREEIAQYLHDINENEIVQEISDGTKYKIGYQDTKRKKTDYDLLITMLTEKDYNRVVEITETTSLVIREVKAKKSGEKTLTNTRPKEDEKLKVPEGTVLA